MKASIKTKWLEALRSGKYKQTRSTLKNEDGYCCLGVLCEIHRTTQKKSSNTWKNEKYITKVDGNCGLPPHSIVKWSGLSDDNGTFKYKSGKEECLSFLNDSGKSFKQIANIIEKYF